MKIKGITAATYLDKRLKDKSIKISKKEVCNNCKNKDICKYRNISKFENGKVIPIMEDGKRVKDSSIAEKLLPSCSGFFFGGTEYDEYYVSEIKETIDIITKALETTDFEKEMIYYVSSW